MISWIMQRLNRPRLSDFERGESAARAFLVCNQYSANAIEEWWSSACEDEAFASDPDYARGVKAVLRLHRSNP